MCVHFDMGSRFVFRVYQDVFFVFRIKNLMAFDGRVWGVVRDVNEWLFEDFDRDEWQQGI